jgi:hypothetical protein
MYRTLQDLKTEIQLKGTQPYTSNTNYSITLVFEASWANA